MTQELPLDISVESAGFSGKQFGLQPPNSVEGDDKVSLYVQGQVQWQGYAVTSTRYCAELLQRVVRDAVHTYMQLHCV